MIALLISMAIFYYLDQENDFKKSNLVENNDYSNSSTLKNKKLSSESSVISKSDSIVAIGPNEKKTLSLEQIQIQKNFVEHLKYIGNCLKIETKVQADLADPNADNLISALRTELGEVVVQLEDWSEVDFESANGEKRRLRTETQYDDPNNPIKGLQLYKLLDNDETELILLDPEKSINPTIEMINELKGPGSHDLSTMKSKRTYFPGGEEVALIEKDSVIESFSLSKENRTVSCININRLDSNCQCIE